MNETLTLKCMDQMDSGSDEVTFEVSNRSPSMHFSFAGTEGDVAISQWANLQRQIAEGSVADLSQLEPPLADIRQVLDQARNQQRLNLFMAGIDIAVGIGLDSADSPVALRFAFEGLAGHTRSVTGRRGVFFVPVGLQQRHSEAAADALYLNSRLCSAMLAGVTRYFVPFATFNPPDIVVETPEETMWVDIREAMRRNANGSI